MRLNTSANWSPSAGGATVSVEIYRHESSAQVAYEDLLWALLNTREFLFNN